MTFPTGTKLGAYEILSPIGAGGMGEVYRARDTKLKREVAIKVLPEVFARDTDRLARFQHEAQVLASLNHPHIAAIYDLDQSQYSQFLVLELVEGETLADRIARGRIPLQDALALAKQIAQALEAAHEKGIIHRDLKPANIKLTTDGRAKVLDFGLAKIREDEESTGVSNSPTLLSATLPGVMFGTAAYMSPEQVRGKDTDCTADLWSFGCVLFEMLSGHSPFRGDIAGDIFAAILKEQPLWEHLPADTPQAIRRLLRRCLQKDRSLRIQHAGDVRIELIEASAEMEHTTSALPRSFGQRKGIVLIAALLLVMLVVLVTVLNTRPDKSDEMRLNLVTPPSTDLISFALSPDGRKLVYVASTAGKSALWLRTLDSTSARQLPRTNDALFPFWSPDSNSLGFFAEGKLKRLDLDGGVPQSLTNANLGFGGTWNKEGTILFSQDGTLFRISSNGGPPVEELAEQHMTKRWPEFLPDEKHFFFYMTTETVRGIYVAELGKRDSHRLLDADSAAVYAPPGDLLFLRQQTLFAQSFDAQNLALSGVELPLAEPVVSRYFKNPASVSSPGGIVFRSGPAFAHHEFDWLDRSGRRISGGINIEGNPSNLSLSPDGRRILMDRTVDGNRDIWLYDFDSNVLSRVTSEISSETGSVWFPDGKSIVYTSSTGKGVFQKSVDAVEQPSLLFPAQIGGGFIRVMDWSRDGKYLLYCLNDSTTSWDVWATERGAADKHIPVARSAFEEKSPQFSPDGRWVAYQSNEPGQIEIYVQSFPVANRRFQISSGGGSQPRWRADGQELFYLGLDGKLMAVKIHSDANHGTLETEAAVSLFPTHVSANGVRPIDGGDYAVSDNGQKFLINAVSDESISSLTIILNRKPRMQ